MTQNSSVTRQEIVFVFDNLPDWQRLVSAAPAGAQVIVLDSNKDGLQQIAEHLSARSSVDAIHLLSHGSAGAVRLGSTLLNSKNIEQYSEQLNAIGTAMTDEGDIFLYGCNTAESTQGSLLLNELARLTRADISASSDATGAADKGGNWILEKNTGEIEANSLSLLTYQSLLGTPSDQDFDGISEHAQSSMTRAGMIYSMANITNTGIAVDEFGVFSIMGVGDPGLVFNPESLSGYLDARISSLDQSEFRIGSVEIDTGSFTIGMSSSLTISGYRDGLAVASDSVNTLVSDSIGSVTYVKNVNEPTSGGILTFNSDWNNIDVIRITGQDVVVAIDALDFEPAILPDSMSPTVDSVTSSNADGTYKAGDVINVQINFSESVTVNGTPQLTLETGATDRTINYTSGSGSSVLTFSYTVQAGDTTAGLDYLSTSALAPNGSTILDAAGNDAILTLPSPGSAGSLGANNNLTVDTTAPSIASVAVPANDTYRTGHQLEFTVNFSEAVIVDTTGGEPRIAVTLDTGGTTYASYVAGSGTSALVFRVVVQTGWQDTNGIALGSTIDLNGGSLQDSAGNIAASSLNGVGALSGVLVDAVPPVVSSINLVGTPITSASSVDYTVVFSKAITGLETSDFVLVGNGVTGSVSSVSGSGTTYTVTVSSIAGNGTLRLDLNSSGTSITDSAGNAIAAGYTAGGIFTIDKTPPGAPSSPIIMAPFSDSGSSDSDGITNITSPLVRISLAGTSAVAGDGLEILLDGNSLGTPLVSTFTDTDISNGYIDIQVANGSLGADGNKVLTARVTDIAGNVGAAGGSFTITLDTTIDAPSAPVLAVASDSGSFDSDRITNVTTPTLTGTAEAGSTVTLYDTDGTTVLGTTTAASGVWSITSSTLADGAHSLTVTATDLAGNVSAPSADLSLIIDTAAPVFASTAVNGKTLVLNYTETSTLDALNLPAPGAFKVLVGAVPNAVTAVAVDPVAKTVTLTLTNAVAAGNAVTVAYEDLSADNDANAIQDLAGNDAATLAAMAVTNNTPAPPVIPTEPTNPTVPPVVSVPVDGVNVTTTTGDGGTTIITVPVVRPTRVDDPNTPDSGLADIPIVKTAGGRSILEVGVPVGVAVKAQGVAAGLRSDAALNELLTRIESAGGNTEQLNLGRTFDSTVSPTTTLHIQTLTLSTGAGFDTSVPLVVRGSALPGDGLQAVILDARALPSGSVIQVDNVDFVTVIGSVRIIGGAGQNMATGDGGAQYIVLGADDDVIHGGGGNDTVGSKGGNDKVYGDAGDDIVFGGAGQDILSGGSGSDRLNGGTGFDVALQQGKRSDYSITLDGAGIKLTHIASGVSDWLVDVEQVRFETGPILTVAHSAAEEAVAFLFQQWMGRDLTQAEGAVIRTLDGRSALQVAELFALVYPQQAAGKTPEQLLDGMEAAGAIRVDAARETTFVGDAGDNTFTPTLGLAWTVDGRAGIDTLVFPATLAQTYIDASTTGFTLQRIADGAMLDVLNVERLTFSDTKLALDLDGHPGQAAKLLGALGGVGLLDNKPLVGEVIRALDAGVSAQSLAQLGLQVLGANTSLEVTQLIWTNVVGSAATSAQLQPFVNMMAQGVTGGELAVLASNLDLNATRIDLVGLTATGIEFA